MVQVHSQLAFSVAFQFVAAELGKFIDEGEVGHGLEFAQALGDEFRSLLAMLFHQALVAVEGLLELAVLEEYIHGMPYVKFLFTILVNKNLVHQNSPSQTSGEFGPHVLIDLLSVTLVECQQREDS